MDQHHNNGAAGGSNLNINNNVPGKTFKPAVPAKPQHLQGGKSDQPAATSVITKGCITPQGWSRQPKFTFNNSQDKPHVIEEKPPVFLESKFSQKYRRVPKVVQKQPSFKRSTAIGGMTGQKSSGNMEEVSGAGKKFVEAGDVQDGKGDEFDRSVVHARSEKDREKGAELSEESKGLGILPLTPCPQPRNKASDPKQNTSIVSPIGNNVSTLNHQALSRSTSSSSNGSVSTASSKSRSVICRVTAPQSPFNDSAAYALPLRTDHSEPVLPDHVRGKAFNHRILAPRPFRAASVDKEPPAASMQSGKPKTVPARTAQSSIRSPGRHSQSSSEENLATSSGEAEDSDEAEMKRAWKRGVSVTRFDSKGNRYKVNPRTGDVMVIEDKLKRDGMPGSEDNSLSAISAEPAQSGTVERRINAISVKGSAVSKNNAAELVQNDKSRERASESSSEEAPPPLLPREKMGRRSKTAVVPPVGRRIRNSMTSGSMYSAKEPKQTQPRDVIPEPTLPPPILLREQLRSAGPTEDYTPMSGSSFEMPIHDKESVSSSGSLNSFLDQTAFEPMGVQQGYEPMESQMEEEDIFASHSPLVEPSKHRAATPEYHEIDPDPNVPIIAASTQITVPLPQANEVKFSSNVPKVSDPPPPLPPLNPSKKRLNYIEVEVGSATGGVRGKSQKTNYTEVVVGSAISKDDNNSKKGKSVKGKLISMFSSKSHEGYLSEGDIITHSKTDDERTTDFSKERNKLKRLSGRLLRKKKQKSKDNSRQATELETSFHSEGGEGQGSAVVAAHGSVTNLSTTSAESSRSLTQVASVDGQLELHHALQATFPRQSKKEDRRQSYDLPRSQMPPKLQEKSLSEVMLSVPMNSTKSQRNAQNSPQLSTKSAGNTPSIGRQAQKLGKNAEGFRAVEISSSHMGQNHLHQQQHRPRSKSPRPVSEPSRQSESNLDVPHSRPVSVSNGSDPAQRSPRLDMVRKLQLPVIKDAGKEPKIDFEQLSPNFPSAAPPSPPAQTPPDLPPAPMRDLKPDRFKKRNQSGSSDVNCSAADDIHVGHDDDGSHGTTGAPRLLPLSLASKSKLVESEPLYQIYRSRTLSHASMRVRNNSEKAKRPKSTPLASGKSSADERWRSDLMTDDAGATTLWRQVKEVVESGVGKDLTNDEMKLQQAQFEVVTSQASYMRSLNILIDHFMMSPGMKDPDVLPKQRRKELFSNIVAVREVEKRFLQEIEQHFWDKLYLTKIAEITARYAKSDFEVYVRYVQNQVYQDRVLSELQKTNERFFSEMVRLASSPACNKLPLLSFLLLPMQRVTRLPLLVSAIVNQADSAGDKGAYDSAKQALGIVSKLVKRCNEGARKMQQTEQLAEIAKEITFAPKVKTYALVSQSRSIVKKGEMSVVMVLDNRKAKSMKLWLFLFSDVLLLARKKSFLETKLEVVDWAKRAMLYVNERAVSENEIFLVLLENCNGKRVELTLTPVSSNELSRWTDALSPQHADESEDSIYESWDCPQYQCVVPYTAEQPDELMLDVGDVMRVLKKTPDGWLEGERLRDNEMGWFPAENCEEIEDEHVRARNLRNLYRIVPTGSVTHE